MARKINWAIAGLGAQAENIAEAIRGSLNGVLAAAADIDIKRAGKFAENFNVKAHFNSLEKLLRYPALDAVFIASPNYLHASQSISALNFGKHVLCEKPMTISLKDALAVKKAVTKNKKIFGVGFHLRFHPLFQEAKKIIQSGKLGKIVFIDMHWSIGDAGETKSPLLPQHKLWRENIKQSGGGALMARGVHLLDLLEFLIGVGANPENILALSDKSSEESVDQLTAGVVRAGNILATLVTSRKIPFALNRVAIYGNCGRLFMPEPFSTDGTGVLEMIRMGKRTVKKFTKRTNLYKEEIKDFANAILKNKAWTGASIDDGIKSAAATEALISSLGMSK